MTDCNEYDCRVYDLTEYKLKRYVDSFYQGSEEWEIAMQLLLMYLDGQIDIRWCSEGMIVEHSPSKSKKDSGPKQEVLIPMSGTTGRRE